MPKASRRSTSARRRLLVLKDKTTDAFTAGSVRERLASLRRALRLTRTGYLALLSALVPWMVARLVAGTALYIFAYGAMLIVVASYALAPRRLKVTGTRRGLRPRASEGDRFDVQVRLEAERSVSTFTLEERLPERLGSTVRVPVPHLGRGQTVHHTYGVRTARRGVYQVGPLVAVTQDPLGLTQRETVIADPFELVVHPRVEVVSDRPLTRRYEDPPIRPPVSRPWPSGLEFYGMREYRPGDELRRIVWRASARMGKLMVREAEEGITDQITVILDTDRGSHSWDADHSESFETGVRAAASLAVRHLRDGYEVTVEANGGRLVRPLRTASQQLTLLDAFARADLGREPLSTCLTRLMADPRPTAHNVLVTPRLRSRDASALRLLLQRGTSILVVALMWDEEASETLNAATALGCQVTAIHPGQDISGAMSHDLGAGTR